MCDSTYLQVDMTSKQVHELFPLEDIVYLTPDSSCVLQSVESHKVYVIGGLVDETVQKVGPVKLAPSSMHY